MRQSLKEKQEALENLRRWIKDGDTVYCVLRSVSRSGMSRVISLVVPQVEMRGPCTVDGCGEHEHYQLHESAEHCVGCTAPYDHHAYVGTPRFRMLHPNYAASTALDYSIDKKREGLRVEGCGMDMGFHLVDSLRAVLGYEELRHEWI